MLDRLIALIGSAIPALLLGVVLVVVTANVLARAVFGLPFHTAHDIALVSFAGVVWFGLVGAAVSGQLFGVDFFVDLLPPRLARATTIVMRLILIAICGAVIHASWAQIETSRFSRFLALGWPKWIVSAGLALAMMVLAVVQLRLILAELSALRAGRRS
jgi:TRAP-type C4-dicarboxylate transport system permease small subunit